MHSCMNGSVHDQSLGAETSRKTFTRRGNSKGEETCQAYVESPARWGNAIPMERWKSSYKCQQVKAKCQQIKAKYHEVIVKYNQIFVESIRYEQMRIKHEQTCECNSSMNHQHTKNQDSPETTHALYTAEIKCVMSRGRRVSKCTLQDSLQKSYQTTQKKRIVRNLAKSYLKKCIPSSSKLKLIFYEYNRHHFSERFGRSKCVLSSKKVLCQAKLVWICCATKNIYM